MVQVLTKWKWSCAYCGNRHLPLVIEHRIPLSRGGGNVCSNVVPRHVTHAIRARGIGRLTNGKRLSFDTGMLTEMSFLEVRALSAGALGDVNSGSTRIPRPESVAEDFHCVGTLRRPLLCLPSAICDAAGSRTKSGWALREEQPTLIRFHRACSWLARVEKMQEDGQRLSLGRPVDRLQRPLRPMGRGGTESEPDSESWRVFIDRIVELDRRARPAERSGSSKRLVLALRDDEYFSDQFLQEPCPERVSKAGRSGSRPRPGTSKNWNAMLEDPVERIYVMRCQLIHGAATYGGKFNRRSLRHCTKMRGHCCQHSWPCGLTRGG